MDHRAGALMGSIRRLRIMLADGNVVVASRAENPELFAHAVGGYGLFGVILSAELEVVPNDIYASQRALIRAADFPATFARIAADPAIGLTYAHLSTAPGSLLDEALVYSYRRVDDAGVERPPLGEVGATEPALFVNLFVPRKDGPLSPREGDLSRPGRQPRQASIRASRRQTP